MAIVIHFVMYTEHAESKAIWLCNVLHGKSDFVYPVKLPDDGLYIVERLFDRLGSIRKERIYVNMIVLLRPEKMTDDLMEYLDTSIKYISSVCQVRAFIIRSDHHPKIKRGEYGEYIKTTIVDLSGLTNTDARELVLRELYAGVDPSHKGNSSWAEAIIDHNLRRNMEFRRSRRLGSGSRGSHSDNNRSKKSKSIALKRPFREIGSTLLKSWPRKGRLNRYADLSLRMSEFGLFTAIKRKIFEDLFGLNVGASSKSCDTQRSTPDLPIILDDDILITRHPSIKPLNTAIAGRPIAISVDLQRSHVDEMTTGSPVYFRDLTPGWRSLKVNVIIYCSSIEFEQQDQEIEIKRDAASTKAIFVGKVSDNIEADSQIEVIANFSYKGRNAGDARRILKVGASAGPQMGGIEADSKSPTQEISDDITKSHSIFVDINARPPDLTVKIIKPDSYDDGRFIWVLTVATPIHGLPGRMNGEVNLGKSADEFARRFLVTCSNLGVPGHVEMLNGIGEQIWEKTPECFKVVYWLMRDWKPDFSIQFMTDDPHVPWELMRPVRPPGTPAMILAIGHPVARWLANHEGHIRSIWPSGAIASIAPNYKNDNDVLKWAQEESVRLISKGARPVRGVFKDVMDLFQLGIRGVKISIVHFAGHGKLGTINDSELHLEDQILTPAHLYRDEVKLGVNQQSFIVLNACEVGGITQVLGGVGGWAAVLSRRQFSGLLAPMWAVYDQEASVVASSFIESVWEKSESAGEALRRIKLERYQNSPTPVAYILYGDVMAIVERENNV